MVKTITFSFTSHVFEGTGATETFTFEELKIDEKLNERELALEVHRIFEAWVWRKLNISYSIITE
ncbi:hypothetical protein H9649_06930 [Sporosarcina sp. Sa2YVA2]|uniref:Uncharacterized protein n=1 Tax=Sporosarcina quadrami TaxID=2762234 RepID=A0ABR8U8F3_9BACL|nr:hypothetical protein [Sporosarcina quadrami]MBD7984306.1 hypothetical protein [Sporosarcina quadrami]